MAKVVIAGGSGFIGQALVKEFLDQGWDVTVLDRNAKPQEGAKVVKWDGKSSGDWENEVSGSDAVVNLSGESLFQKWTPKSKERIRSSRLDTTNAIGNAIAKSSSPPAVWINSSAIGFYGDTGNREVSEASASSKDELGVLCQEWEGAVDSHVLPQTARTKIRTGIVLGHKGGALELWKKVTRFGLGGPMGSGKQYVSWIHLSDLARMIVWLATEKVNGAVNGTSPDPATNGELMASLRKHLGMPVGLPAPVPAAKALCGFMGWPDAMLLGGTKAVPAVAMARGFEFQFTSIDQAMADLVDDTPTAWSPGRSMAV